MEWVLYGIIGVQLLIMIVQAVECLDLRKENARLEDQCNAQTQSQEAQDAQD